MEQTFRVRWQRFADHVAVSPRRMATWYEERLGMFRLSYYVDAAEARLMRRYAPRGDWQVLGRRRWERNGRPVSPAEARRRARVWLAAEAARRFPGGAAAIAVSNPVGERRTGRLAAIERR